MAFQANDGSSHTNMDTMKRSNASFASKQPAAPAPGGDPSGGDPLQSPEVQAVFQALAQAGVSTEEVAQAYAQVAGDDGSGGAPPAGGMPQQ